MKQPSQKMSARLRRYMAFLNTIEDEGLLDAVDTLIGDLMEKSRPARPKLVLVKSDHRPIDLN